MENKLLIIDGSSMLSTCYYATLPPSLRFGEDGLVEDSLKKRYKDILQTSKGVYTNGVYSMLKTFLKVVKSTEATHVAIAWDVSRNTFRKQLYNEYKGTRKSTPIPLKEQFSTAQKMFSDIGVYQLSHENYEADDLAGSLAKKLEDQFNKVIIVTKDQDYLQLTSDKTTVCLGVSTKKYQEYSALSNIVNRKAAEKDSLQGFFPFSPELLMDVYGLKPLQIIDWKAIAGDSSDNIPGIQGIGDLTAKSLLKGFDGLKELQEYAMSDVDDKEFFETCKALGVKRNPRKYIVEDLNSKNLGQLSYELAKIKTDIPIEVNIKELAWNEKREIVEAVGAKLEFRTIYH